MKVIAIANVRNEGDIIALNLRHLIANEVDLIYLNDHGSTDDTYEQIRDVQLDFPKRILRWPVYDPYFQQETWINELAAKATADGADWILPFDADEFFCAPEGKTINSYLAEFTAEHPDVRKLYVKNWPYHTWEMRETEPLRLAKVVYRPTEGAVLAIGQHDVSIAFGLECEIRSCHLQYRSFDHFVEKVHDKAELIPPDLAAIGRASHITRLAGLSDDDLAAEWYQMQGVELVSDPIPVKR